jgi:hypothetical protein
MTETNKIIITAVIAAIIVGGGVYLWLSPKTPTTTQPSTQVSPTGEQVQGEQKIEQPSGKQKEQVDKYAGWKTYRNAEYGFSFKYPGDRYVFENNDLAEKMCQAEFKAEGPIEFPNNDCISKDEVMYLSDINGFCTKGGCVGIDLKRIANPVVLTGMRISKISTDNMAYVKALLLDQKINTIIEQKDINVDGVALSYFYTKRVDGGWDWAIFWTKDSINFLMGSGSEGGGENIAERHNLDQILSTFKFTK